MIRIAIFAGVAAFLIGAFGLTYRAGYKAAGIECDSAALLTQLKVVQDDLARARSAAAEADRQSRELEEQAAQTTGKIDDLEKELAARDEALAAAPATFDPAPAPVEGKCPALPRRQPDRACRATDDDVRRLRAIPD